MKAKLLLTSALLLGLCSLPSFSQARISNRQGCLTPISYRIGALDSRFGITREDFGRAVEEAAGLWESAWGRKLFVRGGAVKINLVYDNRQEATKRVIAARASISEKLKEADLIKDRLRFFRTSSTILTRPIPISLRPTNGARTITTSWSRSGTPRAVRREASIRVCSVSVWRCESRYKHLTKRDRS
jgi:hypothetical protein